MRILLDTNALIWWMDDEQLLGPKARELLANPANEIFASVVSLWEITVKWRIGKHGLPGSAYAELLDEEAVRLLPVEPAHVAALEGLALHHKDPFDHLILAQAKVEDAVLMTSDRVMGQYGLRCVSTH